MGTYDTAQICRNGHAINSRARSSPERTQDFCDRCGEPTLTSSPECGVFIRGYYNVPGVFGGFPYEVPSHCYGCGAAYPWTETHLAAAKELAESFTDLSEDERDELKDSPALRSQNRNSNGSSRRPAPRPPRA